VSRHLLVVGAQRCGTTYLATLLDAHPQVTMARPSRPEPKVFVSDERSARGRDWYRRTYFAHATGELILADKSTSYLEDPRAARRAAGVLDGALVLAQLRDPVDRAVSNWRFSSSNGLEQRALADALEDNLRGARDWDPDVTSVSPFAYLERGCYAHYLEAWFDAFPDAVRVQFLEELTAGLPVAAQMFGWLGVDSSLPTPSSTMPVNASADPAPDLEPDLERRVRAYFADSDERLAKLLGRELPWPSA
jgi:Sulfotransferase family